MLPFPSPEKVPTRMYEGIARRVWTILAHCAERRQQGSLIHLSAWKRNSANFAFWAFSEVELPLYGVLRSSLLRTEHAERLPTVMDRGPHSAGQGPERSDGCAPAPAVVHAGPADHREGDEGDRHGPVLDPPYAPRRAAAVPHSTLCHEAHTSSSPRSMVRSLP